MRSVFFLHVGYCKCRSDSLYVIYKVDDQSDGGRSGIIIRVSGVQVPPPLPPKSDQIVDLLETRRRLSDDYSYRSTSS